MTEQNKEQKKKQYFKQNKEQNNKQTIKPCKITQKCGDCMGQDESYDVLLVRQQDALRKLIGSYGGLEPILGMENPYYYRNKVSAAFSHDKQGNPVCGIYEEGSHRVIPIENCLIEDRKASAIILSIRDLLKSFKIKTYSDDSGYGLLRHVMVRTGHNSGEIMVVLVLSSLIMPSKNNFVKALRKIHPEITTIIINENYKSSNMVLGDKEQVIYGKGFIEDTLCGKKFRISSKSFYPISANQAEVLYKKAIEYAGLTGNETILDAYCGVGTIGMIASDSAKKIISVELNAASIRDAVSNVKRNGISNIDFYTKDVGEFMAQFAESTPDKVDVVFMNPPKSGSDDKFLTALVKLYPEKVVYISSNPNSLVKDLEFLSKKGYQVKKSVGVDLRPWTNYVETVVLLSQTM